MNEPGRTRGPAIAAAAVAAAVAAVVAYAYMKRWPLAMPAGALVRTAAWLAAGVYVSLPVTAAGHLLARRWRGALAGLGPPLVLAVSWGVGWTLVMAGGLALLVLGLYSEWILVAAALAGNLLLLVRVVSSRWRPILVLADAVRREVHEALGSSAGILSWRTLVVLLLVAAALHAAIPPDSRDELAYHLVMPRLWMAEGGLVTPVDNPHLLFPGNLEIAWGYAMAAGGERAPRFVTLVFAMMALLVLRSLLGEAGADGWTRGFCLVFLLATPAFLVMTAVSYVEWPLLFYLVLGWRLSRPDRLGGSGLALAGLAWAACLGVKYTAVPLVGLLVLERLVGLARRGGAGSCARLVAWLALLGALLASPWYIRNGVVTGDPLYPIGGALRGAGGAAQADAEAMTRYAEVPGRWRWFPWAYHATADPVEDHRLHLLWPLLHVAVLCCGFRRFGRLPWLTVAGGTLMFAAYAPSPRVELPLMGLVWVFLPFYVRPFTRDRRARGAATALLLAMVILGVPFVFHHWFMARNGAPLDYTIGLVGRTGFLRRAGLVTPVVEWVSDEAPAGARVWAWCEDRVFYLDRWTRADSPYGAPAYMRLARAGGVRALDEAVDRDGIDLVLVNRSRCGDLATARMEGRTHTLERPGAVEDLHAWMARRLEEMARDDRYVLYRVKR